MIIYKITNKVNNKVYIGQTVRKLSDRMKSHFYQCSNEECNTSLCNAFRKYGKDSFMWEAIHTCDDIDDLNEKEKYYIKKYNSLNENGYNMTEGGLNGLLSDKVKKKMSITRRGKQNPMYGKKRPDLAEYNRRRVQMDDYKNPMEGKVWTDFADTETIIESNKRRSKAMKDKPKSSKTRKKMSNYAKNRFFIVNRYGEIKHCLNENDERLICGNWKRGMIWKDD